jgi:hypothetical protein
VDHRTIAKHHPPNTPTTQEPILSQTTTTGSATTQDTAPRSGCCGGSSRKALTPMTKAELAELPTLTLIARFRRGIEAFDRRVFQLSERQIDMAFLPDVGVGNWPVRVLIGHVADADLAAIHRMRRVVAEEHPVFAEWDENAFVDANIYGNVHEAYADEAEGDHARVMNALGGPMAVIHTNRQWAGQWMMSLDESAWSRTGLHPVRGVMSLRDILVSYVWHLEHHAQFLNRKLDHILGPAPVETAGGECCGGASGGGCGGGGCGCK